MNNNITLNASMRSNLLSLRNISKQMDKTQLILATGKKVNSAIDNASAYYQARSLTNRSADLLELLNSMEQGIQTIEAANQGLTSGLEFLEQASATAMQAATAPTLPVPDKEWFVEKVGANGAVVSTAQELRDAINSGKETICVYGKIDLRDISTSGGLELKENQKLVGVGYFGNYDTTTDKFSSISAISSTNVDLITIEKNNCEVADLSITYDNSAAEISRAAAVNVVGVYAKIKSLNISTKFSDKNPNQDARGAIYINRSATADLEGTFDISVDGNLGAGIFVNKNSTVNILTETNINLKLAKIPLTPFGAISVYEASQINIAGKIQTKNGNGWGINEATYFPGNSVNILATAEIYFDTGNSSGISNSANGNTLDIAAGAKLAFSRNGITKWYQLKENYHHENTSGTSNFVNISNVEAKLKVENVRAWSLPQDLMNEADGNAQKDFSGYEKQYGLILDEYDNLIKDASYQGINLLNGALKEITLNESRSNKYKVEGKDMSSKNIGLSRDKWENLGDVTKAMNELTAAINSVRSFQEKLGNHYSIIKTRINFTEGLSDILETGADNLTLADMNEASAEYLTLQTRQQLAINSLSLASQSARGVLSLF